MILIQGNNPLVKIEVSGVSTKINVCEKNYVFPTDEVHVLDIENITTELLAKKLGFLLVDALKDEGVLSWTEGSEDVIEEIRLGVFETAGQGANYHLNSNNYNSI
jgi:hypothetical protein